MNRLEIIKMVFEKSSDAKEALAIAKEIEEFIGEKPTDSDKPKKKYWTADEIYSLRELCMLGYSAEKIAEKLGRSIPSTEAAISRVNRNEPLGRRQ